MDEGRGKTGFQSTPQMPLDPGQARPVVRSLDGVHGIDLIAISDDYLFFASDWNGVYRIPKYGGNVDEVEEHRDGIIRGLAANDREVFWVPVHFGARPEGQLDLRRRAVEGGQVTILRNDVNAPCLDGMIPQPGFAWRSQSAGRVGNPLRVSIRIV
jgi:hypothetical protein